MLSTWLPLNLTRGFNWLNKGEIKIMFKKCTGDNVEMGDTWKGVETSTNSGETRQCVTVPPPPLGAPPGILPGCIPG
jgi:hypothetical protein